MSAITINLPDELLQEASTISASEHVSMDDIFASAVADKITAFRRLQRILDAGRDPNLPTLEQFLNMVPDVGPEEWDRMPA
jgi:hypothetical protein